MTEERPCLRIVVCVLTLVHIIELRTWTTLPMPTRLVADREEGWPSRRPEASKIVACLCLFSLDMSMHLKNSAVVCE